MSVERSSQTAGERAAEKAHEAAQNAKDTIDAAVRNADEAIRGGVESIKSSVDNMRDAVNEKLHRGAAEAEHTRREVSGDEMTTEDRIVSLANEAKNNAQAGVDAFKQNLRKS
jgi:hypothetical protein